MSLRYRITTLGCRVNHAETRELESVLVSRGLSPAGPCDRADLEVVHSCSVTGAAAAKSRGALRRARRRQAKAEVDGPEPAALEAAVMVTGCYAATDPDEAAAIVGGRDLVVAHADPEGGPSPAPTAGGLEALHGPGAASPEATGAGVGPGRNPGPGPTMVERFAERLDRWLATAGAGCSTRDHPGTVDQHAAGGKPPLDRAAVQTRRQGIRTFPQASFIESQRGAVPLPVVALPVGRARHVRAEIKIQDGCDAHCTFCIIPSTRPTLRSKSLDDVLAEARRLVALGHVELVLSGVFIGAYGQATALRRRQRDPGHALADLVDALAGLEGLRRLRISSMEPGDVTGALLDAMVANPDVVVPHLHLPLQSGSDAVLRRMNRQYRVGDYLDMVDRVNEALTSPDGLPPAITTDVICGFPGEREADFARTLEVAAAVGYLHMHVFPFSPRAGTAAARWTDKMLPADTVRRRVRTLIEMETDPVDGLDIAWRRRLLGRRVRVILEQADREASGALPYPNANLMTGRCDHYALISTPTRRPRGTLVNVRITEVGPSRTFGTIEDEEESIALPVLPAISGGA